MPDQQKPDEPKTEAPATAPARVVCVTKVQVARSAKGGKTELVTHAAGATLPASTFSDVERAGLLARGALRPLE